MTQRKARAVTLKVWRYLAKHPEIRDKQELPDRLYKEIKKSEHECLLCDLLIGKHCQDCPKCPLKSCTSAGDFYQMWRISDDSRDRQFAAQGIVDTVKAWKPEGSYGVIRSAINKLFKREIEGEKR